MKSIFLKALAAVSIVALGVGAAQAATATGDLQVDITISTGCTVNFPLNSGNISFGTYARISSQLIEVQQVSVDCNGATSEVTDATGLYTLSLNEGVNGTGTGATAQRRLANGTNYINYDVRKAVNLSSRSCGGQRWDATTPFTGTITPTTGDNPVMDGSATYYFAVCIPVPATQPAVGTYADSLTATLTY